MFSLPYCPLEQQKQDTHKSKAFLGRKARGSRGVRWSKQSKVGLGLNPKAVTAESRDLGHFIEPPGMLVFFTVISWVNNFRFRKWWQGFKENTYETPLAWCEHLIFAIIILIIIYSLFTFNKIFIIDQNFNCHRFSMLQGISVLNVQQNEKVRPRSIHSQSHFAILWITKATLMCRFMVYFSS